MNKHQDTIVSTKRTKIAQGIFLKHTGFFFGGGVSLLPYEIACTMLTTYLKQ